MEALYICKWDPPREGEEPLERRRATVAKFNKVRGYGTLLDCHTGQTILVNRRAVQRPYLHKKFYTLGVGEFGEYTPVQSLCGEWAAAVTRPTAPTQLPFKYFPSTDWESDPFNLRPTRSAPKASTSAPKEEELQQSSSSSSMYSKESGSSFSTDRRESSPAQVQESKPKLRATKTVPRPFRSNESLPPAQVPTYVPRPSSDMESLPASRVPTKESWVHPGLEMVLKPYCPTVILASNPITPSQAAFHHSILTNVVWQSYVNSNPAPDVGRYRGTRRGTTRVRKNIF
ncbi:uncharacterized protein LOC130276117 [Hyla sarda]|uniref:uncharacterized protein LOC130276117 n=1 Tax=Hyla sarda TaxID=327740 RepID=UPI0024C3AE6E|nr:uncharacterized protein LOC130276117 [Hyla sarda]XP_056381002.1 uncharacterized protein LOC130276117 [Hyla sarda]